MKVDDGNYIKTDEVKNDETLEILDEFVKVKNLQYTYDDGNPKIDWIGNVKYKGETRKFRMNKDSRKEFIKLYGDDTVNWIGKKAKITVEYLRNLKKNMIILFPTDEKEEVDVLEKPVDWDEST